MNALQCYKLYCGLKNHFSNEEYDFFKYSGKNKNVTWHSYHNRTDKFFFEKLSKHPDPVGFLLANLTKNNKTWIGDLSLNEESIEAYNDYCRRRDSLTYLFRVEIQNYDLQEAIAFDPELPILLRDYFYDEISLETMTILFDVLSLDEKWECYLDNPLYKKTSLLFWKYRPFVKMTNEKVLSILDEMD